MLKKISELQVRLNELIQQGQYLSNICYNLAQDSRLDDGYKESIKKQTKDWDKAREKYRQEVEKCTKK
jgi:hypothetical protein